MKIQRFLIPTLAAIFGSAWAVILDQTVGDIPSFKKIDKDQDGYISSDEASILPTLLEQFTKLDHNGDNKLTEEEYAALITSSEGSEVK